MSLFIGYPLLFYRHIWHLPFKETSRWLLAFCHWTYPGNSVLLLASFQASECPLLTAHNLKKHFGFSSGLLLLCHLWKQGHHFFCSALMIRRDASLREISVWWLLGSGRKGREVKVRAGDEYVHAIYKKRRWKVSSRWSPLTREKRWRGNRR